LKRYFKNAFYFDFSKKGGRYFQTSWYIRFPWLEFSTSKEAAFCFPCRLFGCGVSYSIGRGVGDDSFTAKGFTLWKKALKK